MARPDKVAEVKSLADEFTSSAAAVLTEYRGLSVKDLKELRRSLGADATYAVAKNTLTKLAAQSAGIEGLDDALVGPTAIAFIKGDVATVAKGLRDFAKANPLLVIKGGVMDGKVLDASTVKRLADLESREVLLSKLAGAMKGTAQKAVSLFAAPLTQAAQLFGALQDKLSDGTPAQKPEETADAVTPAAAEATPEASDAASAPEDAADAASNE
ncbi:MAG: 50S ribosomal protein L10 [Propionibacteriaceae bacterium]|jgi:large subunit ribosomal protein L10|nr:50S ribosomal protein L10 [Propionibacteriaceae bacterium]